MFVLLLLYPDMVTDKHVFLLCILSKFYPRLPHFRGEAVLFRFSDSLSILLTYIRLTNTMKRLYWGLRHIGCPFCCRHNKLLQNTQIRVGSSQVCYSKSNQGNVEVFDFELSLQEMFEIASLRADGIGPDTCNF